MTNVKMRAKAVVFENRAQLTWCVYDAENLPSAVELRTESGQLIRQFSGKSIGIGQGRSVVFSLPAPQLQSELGETHDLKYIDLIVVDHGICAKGIVRARMYRPTSAAELGRLANQAKKWPRGSSELMKIQQSISAHSADAIHFELNVTELGLSTDPAPSLNRVSFVPR